MLFEILFILFDVPLFQGSCGPQSILPVSCGQYVENFREKTEDSGTPISSNRIPQKYVNLTIGGIPISKRLYESAAVANAAELFKLIFLCSSKSPLVPTLLAETLRRYSEHDLFAAFNYLRDKKVLVNHVLYYYVFRCWPWYIFELSLHVNLRDDISV